MIKRCAEHARGLGGRRSILRFSADGTERQGPSAGRHRVVRPSQVGAPSADLHLCRPRTSRGAHPRTNQCLRSRSGLGPYTSCGTLVSHCERAWPAVAGAAAYGCAFQCCTPIPRCTGLCAGRQEASGIETTRS